MRCCETPASILLGIIFVSMLADTIDVQELNSGRRQEGIFAAALAFSGKATAGVGAVVAGFLLHERAVRLAGSRRSPPIGPAAVIRLGLVAGVLVPFLLIGPLLLGARYEHHSRLARLDPRGTGPAAGGRLNWRSFPRPPGRSRIRPWS